MQISSHTLLTMLRQVGQAKGVKDGVCSFLGSDGLQTLGSFKALLNTYLHNKEPLSCAAIKKKCNFNFYYLISIVGV